MKRMSLNEFIVSELKKGKMKLDESYVKEAIKIYIKAYENNHKNKDVFVYDVINTNYYKEEIIKKEEFEVVSDETSLFIFFIHNNYQKQLFTVDSKRKSKYIKNLESFDIESDKEVVVIEESDKQNYYYLEDEQLLINITGENNVKVVSQVLRITGSLIRSLEKEKSLIIKNYILIYKNNNIHIIYKNPTPLERYNDSIVSKYEKNRKYNYYIVDALNSENEKIRKEAEDKLNNVIDNLDKSFYRLAYYMVKEIYDVSGNNKNDGYENIFKNTRDVKYVPEKLKAEHKDAFLYLIALMLFYNKEKLSRTPSLSEIFRNQKTNAEITVEKLTEITDMYIEGMLNQGANRNNLSIFIDIITNLHEIFSGEYSIFDGETIDSEISRYAIYEKNELENVKDRLEKIREKQEECKNYIDELNYENDHENNSL